jgi:hypothetical protein
LVNAEHLANLGELVTARFLFYGLPLNIGTGPGALRGGELRSANRGCTARAALRSATPHMCDMGYRVRQVRATANGKARRRTQGRCTKSIERSKEYLNCSNMLYSSDIQVR